MSEQTLRQKLEYYGCTLNEPDGGLRGYRSLLLQAGGEIDRLAALQAPVHCFDCKREIARTDEWFRCFDCRCHLCERCIGKHFGHDQTLRSAVSATALISTEEKTK